MGRKANCWAQGWVGVASNAALRQLNGKKKFLELFFPAVSDFLLFFVLFPSQAGAETLGEGSPNIPLGPTGELSPPYLIWPASLCPSALLSLVTIVQHPAIAWRVNERKISPQTYKIEKWNTVFYPWVINLKATLFIHNREFPPLPST